MELIRGIRNIKARHYGCALSIGNFDGVHLGHQQVIKRLVEQARQRGLPAAVMIFEPQPLEIFAKDKAPARISRFRDKYQQLKSLGVDRLLVVRFNQAFAQQSADYFVRQLLVELLGIKYLAVGDDFHFGKGREGNFASLQAAKQQYGFELTSTDSFCMNQQRVSSTLLRQHLADSDFNTVGQLLGRKFSFSGKVIHGQKLGRQLGFATANLKVARHVCPIHGVFAVKVYVHGQPEHRFSGIANIGWRPTAAGKDLLVEAHLFEFDANLYGQRLVVEPQLKIRDEQKFDSLDALKAQVNLDIKRAKAYYGLAE
ncbi:MULTISPECIES: bifunctional riboflavin kinase/FAD synthetase [unclassified Agarivorans]|uniref:bifunctional riboflavin kinase/FAD synthetase n=1 Tax=unclassified Agarivorans TaxID=2636026 RepID=UPI0010E3FD1A|nr:MULTISPECIES: bifunctional riboflavin kinase/FAD synthetase [unclassified Agarivorans]MDO6685085.1 bifunctional riboflavin kinase/FAD synthetase [Agarivorans sp. 3_MG-2023]MDO6715743.1 bifunctional riboflavin kinase/FAD synthetase [Agarivorans sp. 2_MG-2023]MDO6763894.1 bifunctional riboflavin kinase/FAD synthetase [Agarivorans sp. 1_MG-2023]GDY27789.1 riboflavin biosynthesis protein [Agarivorans sp. Toyoura001]